MAFIDLFWRPRNCSNISFNKSSSPYCEAVLSHSCCCLLDIKIRCFVRIPCVPGFVVLGDQQQCICVLPAKLNCGTIQKFFYTVTYNVTYNDSTFKTYFTYNLRRPNGWECMKSKHQKDRRMKRGTYMSEVFHLCLTILWRKIEKDEY